MSQFKFYIFNFLGSVLVCTQEEEAARRRNTGHCPPYPYPIVPGAHTQVSVLIDQLNDLCVYLSSFIHSLSNTIMVISLFSV